MSKKFLTTCCSTILLLVNCTVAIKEGCRNNHEDWMSKCHVQLPVLTSPDIPVAMTQEELDKSCIELQGGIRCVQNFTEHCMEKHEQVTFRRIYAGITDVVQELCQKGKYQEEYLKHATCIKRVRSEYEECSRKYERTLTMVHNKQQNEVQYRTDGMEESDEEQQVRTICCSFQEYLLCSEQTVQMSCGDEAALFTSAFLKRMASNIIKNFCLSYRGRECSRADDAVSSHFSPLLVGASLLLQGYRAALVAA